MSSSLESPVVRSCMWRVTPDSLRIVLMAALARLPKIASGSSSGVTRLSSTSGRSCAAHSAAVIKARSYRGSGQLAPAGLDECHLLDPALAQLVEQQPVVGSVATAAVGEDSLGVPLALRTRAQGEHKHVVTERLTISRDHTVLRVYNAVERSTVPVSAELRRGVLQAEPSRALCLERLLRGHRAIDELQLGGQDRDVDAVGGQRT